MTDILEFGKYAWDRRSEGGVNFKTFDIDPRRLRYRRPPELAAKSASRCWKPDIAGGCCLLRLRKAARLLTKRVYSSNLSNARAKSSAKAELLANHLHGARAKGACERHTLCGSARVTYKCTASHNATSGRTSRARCNETLLQPPDVSRERAALISALLSASLLRLHDARTSPAGKGRACSSANRSDTRDAPALREHERAQPMQRESEKM
eukprot:536507-Pleurochrysis_carterae.AAC.1